MKKRIFFMGVITLFTMTTWGQKKSSKKEINNLIGNPHEDSTNLYTSSALNKFIHQQINIISGTNIKEGNIYNTSGTIDDKGINVNVNFLHQGNFFSQISITGAADKGFLDIFSQGEYQKTLSGGFNFQWFPFKNKIGFHSYERIELHNRMRFKKTSYEQRDSAKQLQQISKIVKLYKEIDSESEPFIYQMDKNALYDKDTIFIDQLKLLDSLKLILTKYKIIDPKEKNYRKIYNILGSEKNLDSNVLKDAIENLYLDHQDSLQLSVKTAYFIQWISGGINYNINPQQVLSDTITSGLKPSKYLNEYLTLKLAYNGLWVRNNPDHDKIYFSISLNYSTERKFNPEKERKVNFGSNTTINGLPVQNVDEKTFYTSIPDRANILYADIPCTYFFTKRNFGIDAGVKLGVNDPQNNNVSARIGVYVPINSGESILFIEPILKFEQLFSSSKNDFIKDNLGFGFNLSVSLPKYVKN